MLKDKYEFYRKRVKELKDWNNFIEKEYLKNQKEVAHLNNVIRKKNKKIKRLKEIINS